MQLLRFHTNTPPPNLLTLTLTLEKQIKRFCASILKWSEINLRVKLFGMCAGMVCQER
jgi:hypothetical protein